MSNQNRTISDCLAAMKDGDQDAVHRLWDLCFDDLVRVAKRKLQNLPRRADDEEDLALSAFHSLYRGAQAGRFKQLTDKDDLWQILLMITSRKAINRFNAHTAQKRGGGNVRGESVFDHVDDDGRGIEEHAIANFSEQLSAESEELLQMLDDDLLREIALLKLAGHTNVEIATKVNRAKSTVDLKLSLIKKRWVV